MREPLPSEVDRASPSTVVSNLISALNGEDKARALLNSFSPAGALARYLLAYTGAYPGFKVQPLDNYSEDDLVVFRFGIDLAGTYSGWRIDTGPQPEMLEAIAVCRVIGGVITDLWLALGDAGSGSGAAASGEGKGCPSRSRGSPQLLRPGSSGGSDQLTMHLKS